MTLVQKEPKAIKIGTTDIKKVYLGSTQVRPKPRTFTISWTEQSNMSSGWTYSDDAAGLTAGSGDFDDFFGYSAVLLDTSGNETAEMTQSGGVFPGVMTTLGNITSGDNVMIKFPVRGIKMTKSGSVVTLSITEELNKTGYQYYAHCTGTLSNPGTPEDAFYLGAYKAYNNSNVLKSWSGRTPSVSATQSDFCTYAKANGSGYNILGFYQDQYINALYMMKYGNPNSKEVVGHGWSSASNAASTGGTNSQTSATYGTTANWTTQCRLFGLEDRWGNIAEFVGGTYTDASRYLYTQLSGYSGTLSGGESTGSILNGIGNDNLTGIIGDNKSMFQPSSVNYSSTYSEYYCSFSYTLASKLMVRSGWYNTTLGVGAIYSDFECLANSRSSAIGTRLMYLNGLT